MKLLEIEIKNTIQFETSGTHSSCYLWLKYLDKIFFQSYLRTLISTQKQANCGRSQILETQPT